MNCWHVFELMTRAPYCAHPEDDLATVVLELVKRRATVAPVVDQQSELVGLLSLTDVAVDRVMQPSSPMPRVKDLMQRRVIAVDQATSVVSAIRQLREHGIHHLVVSERERVVGIVSSLDLLQVVLDEAGYHPPVL